MALVDGSSSQSPSSRKSLKYLNRASTRFLVGSSISFWSDGASLQPRLLKSLANHPPGIVVADDFAQLGKQTQAIQQLPISRCAPVTFLPDKRYLARFQVT